MSFFRPICEQLRTAIDAEGAKGCYKKSVRAYAKVSGIPEVGLWAVVDAVLQAHDQEKTLKKLCKSYGGTPELWLDWWAIAKGRPDCNPGD